MKHVVLGAILVGLIFAAGSGGASQRPNILLIMADDIGIEGLGCYGGQDYQTPHLDKLAAEGMRFTHAYSQPLCTPTRVQIMTGKYNHRNWQCFGVLPQGTQPLWHPASGPGRLRLLATHHHQSQAQERTLRHSLSPWGPLLQ